MIVLVVGAAGKTGQAVVDRALEHGHEVTAFVHRAEGYDVQHVQVRAGDAIDVAAVGAAVSGQDAVINTVGGKTPYKHTTLEAGMAAAILAGDAAPRCPPAHRHLERRRGRELREHALLRQDPAGDVPARGPGRQDRDGGGGARQRPGLGITRPAVLTDKPATGDVRVLPLGSRARADSLTRTDLAAFLVAQLTSDTYLRQAVTLTNR